jgi:hypothetical protein
MTLIRELLERLVVWYWRDPVAAERHRVEADARRLNGTITWHN